MATDSHPGFNSVVIVGAGPSGLLLALCLATLNPRPTITILDAAETLNTAPRATHHAAPAIKLFRQLGILPEIRRDGYMPLQICWRKLNGERLAGFDRTNTHDGDLDGDGLTVYPIGILCELLIRELKARADIHVTWGSKVVSLQSGLEPGDKQATVEVEEDGKTKTYVADYVIGTDGGNSTVRRLMFGKRNFPGFTWEEQIVATNTEYDFDQFGWEDTQFIIDPVHWYMAARIGPHPDPKKNLWRISYGELPGLSNEELMERQPMKFEQMLPGHPKPGDYRVVAKSPYKVHQRCCESMRINRIMLAADAAHLCNPFGGMGLTGGVVDVDGLFQCLEGIHRGVADDSVLNTWSDVQRQKWHEIINPVSSGNIKRLFAQDPDKALEEDEFLKMVKKAETDDELSEQMQQSGYSLLHDYSQYFKTSKA
jgi:2-polyprenyl-6-methoxyphenol hydroxylase-like FAD-dependent oxidoreductase